VDRYFRPLSRAFAFAVISISLLAAPALAEQIHGVDVGNTVLLKDRTQTSNCTMSPNPDRQCSPGAYYSALTKKRICAADLRRAPGRKLGDTSHPTVTNASVANELPTDDPGGVFAISP
jgi:hypothetical protein